MDVKAYLARIGINEELEPNIENLRKIQSRHLLTVPFENLNIHIYHKLSPDPDELFEKIVLGRRGGVCYELNYLYMLLLEELGYKVSFYGGRTAETSSFYDHSFPMVEIGGKKYISDVGFGDNFLYPSN
jgi:N-hydroxyarylamine O-acetyltransferase